MSQDPAAVRQGHVHSRTARVASRWNLLTELFRLRLMMPTPGTVALMGHHLCQGTHPCGKNRQFSGKNSLGRQPGTSGDRAWVGGQLKPRDWALGWILGSLPNGFCFFMCKMTGLSLSGSLLQASSVHSSATGGSLISGLHMYKLWLAGGNRANICLVTEVWGPEFESRTEDCVPS